MLYSSIFVCEPTGRHARHEKINTTVSVGVSFFPFFSSRFFFSLGNVHFQNNNLSRLRVLISSVIIIHITKELNEKRTDHEHYSNGMNKNKVKLRSRRRRRQKKYSVWLKRVELRSFSRINQNHHYIAESLMSIVCRKFGIHSTKSCIFLSYRRHRICVRFKISGHYNIFIRPTSPTIIL